MWSSAVDTVYQMYPCTYLLGLVRVTSWSGRGRFYMMRKLVQDIT